MDKNICEKLPFGRCLAILTKSYFGALTKRLEHLEIERYYSILILIENSPNGCSQQYICDHLKMDKVSMVRIIEYLTNKKFVKKVLNPLDRREYFVMLTSKAIKTMPQIHQAISDVTNEAMRGISKQDQKIMYNSLSAIQKNLESLPSQKIYINYKKASKKNEI